MALSDFLNGYTTVSLYSRYSLYSHYVHVAQKNVTCCTKNYDVSTKKFSQQLCLGAIQKVRTLSRGGGYPKSVQKRTGGGREVMQECTYAHNLANTRSFYFVLLCLFP